MTTPFAPFRLAVAVLAWAATAGAKRNSAQLAQQQESARQVALAQCLAGLTGETPLSLPDPPRMNAPFDDQFIVKKTFNENKRALFVVGLEGTGHHMVRDLLGYLIFVSIIR